MPRFGFAYQPNNRLVVRGGYSGTSFFEGNSSNQRLTSMTPFIQAINFNLTATFRQQCSHAAHHAGCFQSDGYQRRHVQRISAEHAAGLHSQLQPHAGVCPHAFALSAGRLRG